MRSLEEYKNKQEQLSDYFNEHLNSEDGIVLEDAMQIADFYNKIDKIITEASTDIYKRVIDNPTLVKNIGFMSSNNIYNENVYIKEFDKPLRGRSELLILDGDKVLLRKDSKGGYTLPGGGWEKDEDHNISAKREANEECRVKVKDISYSNTYAAIFPPKDWVKEKIDKENWWYGEYCEVYVGTYDGKFTGKVDLIDQDNKMKNESKFYTIDSVKDILLDQHKKAIEEYKQNVVKEDYQGQHTYYHYIYFEDDGSVKYDGCTVDINDLGSVYKTPFDISMIPNNMGINLCNVEKISWEELFDGQLVNIEIKFKPDLGKENLHFGSTNECVEYIEEFKVPVNGFMRPATSEERESLYEYINSISKPIGVNFFDLLDEAKQEISMDGIKDFNKELNSWDYGVLINGKVETEADKVDWSKYKTIPINLIEKHHVGICWDFVNYEYDWFKKNRIPCETYMFVMQKSKREDDIVTHTFLIFAFDSKKYWFESSWFGHQGIKEVKSYEDVVKELIDKYGEHPYSVFKYNPTGLDKNVSNGEFFKRTTKNLVKNVE